MFAQVSGDVVTCASPHIPGIPVPADLVGLPAARLRWTGVQIIDAASVEMWHVDDFGQKHLQSGAGRQAVTCAWDARLQRDGAKWRVMTAVEQRAPAVKAECARRIFAVASGNTQMNLTAAAAAGVMSEADAQTNRDQIAWVAAMRARCTDHIANGTPYLTDAAWPAPSAAVLALAAKF